MAGEADAGFDEVLDCWECGLNWGRFWRHLGDEEGYDGWIIVSDAAADCSMSGEAKGKPSAA